MYRGRTSIPEEPRYQNNFYFMHYVVLSVSLDIIQYFLVFLSLAKQRQTKQRQSNAKILLRRLLEFLSKKVILSFFIFKLFKFMLSLC